MNDLIATHSRRLGLPFLMAALLIALHPGAGSLQAETLLLRGATVHTVSGEVFPTGDVLIENGKVKAVAGRLDVLADKTVSLAGQHLYPGLIAMDSALGLAEISGVRATRDNSESGEYVPDVQSWVAVNPDSELIPVARASGVTHAEPAPQGVDIAGQSALIVLQGWTTEEMISKKPVALHLYWPSMDLNITPKEQFKDKSKWKSLEDQARERGIKLKEIEDFFADSEAYAQAREDAEAKSKHAVDLNPSWEAMRPFVRGKLPIMVHADEIRQIKAAVKWAKANNFKIVLVGGRDAFKVADLLAGKNIPVVYESVFAMPARDTEPYDVHFSAPGILASAGVKLAIGLGSEPFQANMIRNLPHAAAQAAAFGLPCDQALRAITLHPAQILGVADRLGSIQPGRDATLFSSNGDILDLRSSVQHVWIEGKEVSLDNRHARLYEKYKNRPRYP